MQLRVRSLSMCRASSMVGTTFSRLMTDTCVLGED
jgi:hypothetical protein